MRLLILLSFALFAVSVCAQKTLTQHLHALVQGYHDDHDFQGAVLVAKDGEILYQGAFGWADKARGTHNTIDTKFLIGSTTKSFTALTCMQFVERGHIQLDTPIIRYLPQLKPQLGALTLHQLLKMQSGLPNHLARITDIEARDIAVEEIVDLINSAELAYTPGTQYSYSNLNYHLAAASLVTVSGMSYTEILDAYTFTPLAMDHSGVERLTQIPGNRALGYDARAKGRLVQSYPNYTAWAIGSGDLYSTVGDLLRWDQALYDHQYISQTGKLLAFDGGPEEFGFYGYGFRIMDYKRGDAHQNPGTLVRHGGSMYGYLANVHRYLDDRITVIVLANVRPFPIRDMTFQLKELVLGRDPGPRDFE